MTPEKANANPEWRTPRRLFVRLGALYGPFDLDAAATGMNALAQRFYSREENGLVRPWNALAAWCNPPYGSETPKWIDKAVNEVHGTGACHRAVLLLPGRTDTRWFHERLWPWAREILLMKGRVPFEGFEGQSPMFPSLIAVIEAPRWPGGPRVVSWDWKKEIEGAG